MNKFQAALHHARPMIESGHVPYICVALKQVGKEHPDLASAAFCVRQHIEKDLGNCTTLGSWAFLTYDDRHVLGEYSTLARLAWIDKLMLYFAQ